MYDGHLVRREPVEGVNVGALRRTTLSLPKDNHSEKVGIHSETLVDALDERYLP